MKRLLILFILLSSLEALAQDEMTPGFGYGARFQRLAADSFFRPPVLPDTSCALLESEANGTCFGAIIFLQTDSTLYQNVGYWRPLGKLPDGVLDSARRSNDTLYFRTSSGSEIAVKMEGILIPGIVGLQDSLNARWSLKGNSLTAGQYFGSNNNQEVTIKTNGDTAIRIMPSGQVIIRPRLTSGVSSLLLQNPSTPNGLLTNTMFSLYKASLGGVANDHIAGVNLFPVNGWSSLTQGPVWYYGFAPAEKAGYLTFAARDQFTNFFPYITVNKSYWLGFGRTGTTTGIDATAIVHIAPGVDSVAPLKFTTGALLTTPQKGAVEFANEALYFTRDAGRNKFLFEGYTDTVTVSATGGDYATLSALFAAEPAGNTLILLPDSAYNELNPQLTLKQGWHIKGQGMGKTIVRFTFNRAIVSQQDGFQLKTDCTLEDIQVQTMNKTAAGGSQSFYAVHSDIAGEFTAKVLRCHLRIVKDNPNAIDVSGYNGLVAGVGTWEGQVIEFIDCVIEGQTVSMESRGVINSHNTLATSNHIKPSRLTFKGCSISGGFNAVFINDTYTGTEPDSARTKDLWEFLGCTIQGGINFRSQGAKKNGFAFNFAGTTVDEIRNADSIVNTALSNYDASSLPLPATVEYWKNVGATNIVAGDLVAYVYANRDPYWNYSTPINTPIGIEKIPSGSTATFAGIALTNSDAGRYAHVAVGGIAYHNVAYAGINVGQNVTMSSVGALAVANGVGVGRVERKTSTNMLGISLNPAGVKGNNTSVVSGFTSRLLVGSAVDDGATALQVGGQSSFSSNAFMPSGGLWFNAVGSFILGIYQTGGTDLKLRTNSTDRVSIDSDGEITMLRSLALPGPLATSGNLTLSAAHYSVRVTNTAHAITLPAASTCSGRLYVLVNYNTGGNVTISSVNRDGAAVTALPNNAKWTIQSDGTNWYVIQD